MNTRRCLRIADRIDVLLQQRLGRGIDLQRMVGEPLYRRDVLLVCDAHRGEKLADLAREFREAMLEPPPEELAADPSALHERGRPGLVSSLVDAFRPSQSEASSLPPPDSGAGVGTPAAAPHRPRMGWYASMRGRR